MICLMEVGLITALTQQSYMNYRIVDLELQPITLTSGDDSLDYFLIVPHIQYVNRNFVFLPRGLEYGSNGIYRKIMKIEIRDSLGYDITQKVKGIGEEDEKELFLIGTETNRKKWVKTTTTLTQLLDSLNVPYVSDYAYCSALFSMPKGSKVISAKILMERETLPGKVLPQAKEKFILISVPYDESFRTIYRHK